jgi:phosphate transport system ATP-binding protein
MNESLVEDNDPAAGHEGHDAQRDAKIQVRDVNFWYGEKQVLFNVSLDIHDAQVTAFIGPSGCGKSTLLKCFNRTNELVPNTLMKGQVLLDGVEIYRKDIDPPFLRRRFGWVAQKPNPFPKSIYYNVAYGARLHGFVSTREDTDELVERCLRQAGLWEEVSDRLEESGLDLSGGQQQRLCIARALATEPDVILMDEPCSALDPVATAHVEDLMAELQEHYTIIIITHNMQQAARVSQRTAYFHLGELVEYGDTDDLFMHPRNDLTQRYITGRFG